ncbi:MAG TPA: N-glycosylase/DNA lyase [archaeon]|nr:N-glycosylase/DNA lyase [archaeon]
MPATKNVETLLQKYEQRKDEIKKRLEEFRNVFNQDDKRIFTELAFCLCTPQSKATSAWNAITALTKNNFLFSGTEQQIQPFLNTVRFNESKSKHIAASRNMFTSDGEIKIKQKLLEFGGNQLAMREWFAENVMGLGMKEASHFLRNVGFGSELAILDRHILKNLYEYGAIEELPKTLTEKKYVEIEKKMKEFAEKIGIPFEELDLLLWAEETGFIFK